MIDSRNNSARNSSNRSIMTQSYPDTLRLSRKVLSLLIKLNVLMGIFILTLLIASLVAEDFLMRALGAHHPNSDNAIFVTAVRVIMVIGILSVPLAHVVLTRLQDIVETVKVGDPFVAVNAARLQTIAWAVLGLEMMHLVVGAVAAIASSEDHPLDLDWNFSVTRWLAVLLLFVLARVFDQGTRMREELDGTV
jgi:hypothetical protein